MIIINLVWFRLQQGYNNHRNFYEIYQRNSRRVIVVEKIIEDFFFIEAYEYYNIID